MTLAGAHPTHGGGQPDHGEPLPRHPTHHLVLSPNRGRRQEVERRQRGGPGRSDDGSGGPFTASAGKDKQNRINLQSFPSHRS